MDKYGELLSLFKEALADTDNTHKARAFARAYNAYLTTSRYSDDDSWLMQSLVNDTLDWELIKLLRK